MKRIVGARPNDIPVEILNDEELHRYIAKLPPNYNFEIPKTVWRIRQASARRISLQLPEGLQMFACSLVDIFQRFAGVEAIVQGDVVYGACCVDDLNADELGADLLVHYGHSCLVPINETCMKTLYVFVEIAINVPNLVDTIRLTIDDLSTSLALVGTVQFTHCLPQVKAELERLGYSAVSVPQAKPRVRGELLGCTSPPIPSDVILSVADGRFHLEAAMIQNPLTKFYRYDPYQNKLFIDTFDMDALVSSRVGSVTAIQSARHVGIILGTLGRQGNLKLVSRLEGLLKEHGKTHSTFLMSEVTNDVLELYPTVDVWIQTSCPRLSMDWGTTYSKPLLSPYEAFAGLQSLPLEYPMDNYADRGGPWSNFYREP
jgi:2-(3-amino-3-carboxypropyl)histidine synthase